MEIFSYMHIKKSQLVNHFYLSNMFTPDFFNGLVYCYGMRYHQKISVPVPQVWSEGWQLQLGKSIKSTNLELLNVFTWCSWSCTLNPNSGCHPKNLYPSHCKPDWLQVPAHLRNLEIRNSISPNVFLWPELPIFQCLTQSSLILMYRKDTLQFSHWSVIAVTKNGNISVTKAPMI